MRLGFKFTFPDAGHVKMTAMTPAGEMSVMLMYAEFEELSVAVLKRYTRADLREIPVMVGEEAEGEP